LSEHIQKSAEKVARLAVLGAALLFSTGGTAIKLSALAGPQLACFRSGVAAVLLWMLVPEWRRGWRPASLLVGLAFGATMVLFVTANTLTTAANAIFLQYSAPLYLLLFAPWLLGEANRRSDVGLLLLLGVGMLLFFVGREAPRQTAPDPFHGNLLGGLSGVTWALTLLGLRWLSRREGGSSSSGPAVIAGNVLAFVVCLPWAVPVQGSRTVDWVVVIYLGAVQVAAAYLLLLRGVKGLRAVEVSLLLLIEPVASTLLAWVIHGEVPGVFSAAGCVMILAGVAAQVLRKPAAD